ncbi:hypothetical protein VNO80_23961 [Phaseolus coccineus]|uniref:Uncharacterized protein n=1 Tax=Phaseolus coccineus TaxID=3886 RepID=A0AAN9LRX6_PHACN
MRKAASGLLLICAFTLYLVILGFFVILDFLFCFTRGLRGSGETIVAVTIRGERHMLRKLFKDKEMVHHLLNTSFMNFHTPNTTLIHPYKTDKAGNNGVNFNYILYGSKEYMITFKQTLQP